MAIIQVYEGKELTEYQLPDTWADVKLHQYCGLIIRLEKERDERMAVMMRTIEALTDMTIHQVNRIPYKHLFKIYEHLMKLLNIEPNQELVFKIAAKDKTYGFHPRLSDITLGEYADLEHFIKLGLEKHLPEIMAILYRPIIDQEGDKYKIEEYGGVKEEDIEFMKNINMDIVHSASAFFLELNKELEMNLVSYLEDMKTEITEQGYQMTMQKLKNLKTKL